MELEPGHFLLEIRVSGEGWELSRRNQKSGLRAFSRGDQYQAGVSAVSVALAVWGSHFHHYELSTVMASLG